jgi:hypothetical protein
MYRWLLLLVSIFIFHPGLHAEGDCYVVVEDRMGLATTAELASLQITACAIREVLPEALQSEFIVIEEGEYLFSTLFDTAKDSLGWDRFRTLSDEHLAFLYISRYVDSKGAYRFKTWLQLPESEDHSCINQGLLNVLAEQVSASMNASDAIAYIEKERDGLKLLRSALDKAYNCCNPTENKSVSYCSSCEYGAESDQENATGFLEYEAMIMSTTVGGPFLLLENLTNIVAVRDTTGNSDLKVEISAEWKWLPGSFMAGSYGLVNLTTELKELQARGGGDINVRSRLFDHTNCAELLSTLANWSTPLSDDSFAAAAYAEELIVLSLGGETRVYSRLRSAYPVLPPTCDLEDDETGTETFTNADGEEKGAVLIPAYIVQQILKRALMGTVGVFIDVGLSVSIEKVFHQLSDECEVNSWGAAWNRYREKASGWQLLITFIDSAVSNDLASIFAGGLGEAVAYLLNSETGGNLKSASEFRVTIFFTKFVKGCATSAVTDVLLRFAKHGKAVIVKLKGDNLPPALEKKLTKELSELFPFFLKYRERGVGAWEAAFDLNISSAVRSRPSFLQAFNEILENTNLTEHIFKGKIEITGGTPGAYSFKVGGVHHVDALNGTIARIKSGTMTPPNSKGYYEARVEMHHPDNVNNSGWKVKPDRSTFFPDTWSKQKVQSEIAMVLETGNHTVMPAVLGLGI